MAIHRLSLPGIVANDASSSARQAASVTELNDRAREVLRLVVESYVETGDPVGSRALTRKITETLESSNWSQTEAAEKLRIPLSTLNQKIKRLDIKIRKKSEV